jgi:hypothetical protein
MRFRKLRIAWSVAWGVVAVLVCAAWVQSYLKYTSVEVLVTPAFRYSLHSVHGTLALDRWYRTFSASEFMPRYQESDMLRLATNAGLKIERSPAGGIDAARVSYWLLNLTVIVIAAIPWLPWSSRFSLRTLLLATTLVAIGLGFVVYVLK